MSNRRPALCYIHTSRKATRLVIFNDHFVVLLEILAPTRCNLNKLKSLTMIISQIAIPTGKRGRLDYDINRFSLNSRPCVWVDRA